MIIVITNRSLPVIPQEDNVNIKVSALGVDLGSVFDNGNRIHTAIFKPERQTKKPKTSMLTFCPHGKEDSLFKNIDEIELNKPWVFFVHGFHQDPGENINKAKAIQDNHNVNVITFSWPSRPLDKTISWSDVGSDALLKALKGKSWQRIAGEAFISKLAASLKDRWYNYQPAIINAEKSHVDLIAAINLVNEKLKTKEAPMLLVHSMGNYLLQNVINKSPALPMTFNHIMLHQADVTVPNHDWVLNLNENLVENKRLYITTNFDDNVLSSSQARRLVLKIKGKIPKKESTRRMGRYIQDRLPNIHYLDFTDGEEVNDEHEFFQRSENQTNPYIYNLLGRIFRS